MWPLGIGAFILGTGACLYIYTLGARPEIEANDPQYASALYRSLPQQFLHRAYPVRAHVLFLRTPPANLRSTIHAMRIVCAAHFVLLAVLVTFVAHELIAA
jgi:hypothetical protein